MYLHTTVYTQSFPTLIEYTSHVLQRASGLLVRDDQHRALVRATFLIEITWSCIKTFALGCLLRCLKSMRTTNYVSFSVWFRLVPISLCVCTPEQAESLSITFLITWLLGDITNLLGCIYTHQFPTQLYTAYYFLFMDGVVLSQWIYYYYKWVLMESTPPLRSSRSWHVYQEQGQEHVQTFRF